MLFLPTLYLVFFGAVVRSSELLSKHRRTAFFPVMMISGGLRLRADTDTHQRVLTSCVSRCTQAEVAMVLVFESSAMLSIANSVPSVPELVQRGVF